MNSFQPRTLSNYLLRSGTLVSLPPTHDHCKILYHTYKLTIGQSTFFTQSPPHTSQFKIQSIIIEPNPRYIDHNDIIFSCLVTRSHANFVEHGFNYTCTICLVQSIVFQPALESVLTLPTAPPQCSTVSVSTICVTISLCKVSVLIILCLCSLHTSLLLTEQELACLDVYVDS